MNFFIIITLKGYVGNRRTIEKEAVLLWSRQETKGQVFTLSPRRIEMRVGHQRTSRVRGVQAHFRRQAAPECKRVIPFIQIALIVLGNQEARPLFVIIARVCRRISW